MFRRVTVIGDQMSAISVALRQMTALNWLLPRHLLFLPIHSQSPSLSMLRNPCISQSVAHPAEIRMSFVLEPGGALPSALLVHALNLTGTACPFHPSQQLTKIALVNG
jgi:hypothetical protein